MVLDLREVSAAHQNPVLRFSELIISGKVRCRRRSTSNEAQRARSRSRQWSCKGASQDSRLVSSAPQGGTGGQSFGLDAALPDSAVFLSSSHRDDPYAVMTYHRDEPNGATKVENNDIFSGC